ncbi:acyl carrier protein [Novispirillum itersonii]|uniref:acyl carrier protein n=1 Tax=Novispirillum itersonii TaxID=189 RepID=UPI00037C182D|nr:phosphopantetheine-binding protein [Novispirillum itersonii]
MTRDDVLDILRQETIDILDLPADTVMEDGKSFADYGAISIDIVTIVSGVMRRLNVSVPRQDLYDVHSLGQLVDVLHSACAAKE